MNYYKRVGYIEISDANGNMIRYGGNGETSLDFKFNIKWPIYARRIEADIAILGLSEDVINYLTTISDIASAQRENKRISVYAGYEDTGPMLLFTGYIIYARATKPPEMWINIKASNASFHQDDNLISINIIEEDNKKLKFKELCEKVCSEIGYSLNFKAYDFADIEIESFECVGTKSKIISSLNSMVDDVYIFDSYNGILTVAPKKEKGTPSPKETISGESGLLDITNVNFVGIEIVRFLDTTIGMCDWFCVNSKTVRKANTGIYRAYEITYKGHLRGQEWYSIITGQSLKALQEK